MNFLKKTLPMLLIAGLTSFAACNKSEDDPYKPAPATSGSGTTTSTTNNPPASQSLITMNVGGSTPSWEAKTFNYTTYYNSSTPYNLIYAGPLQPVHATLTIKFPMEKGEYELGENKPYYAKYGDKISTSGKLVVTDVDKTTNKVSGTFNFTTSLNTITDGKFINVPEKK